MKKAVSVCIALLGVIFCLGFGAMDSSAAQTGSDKGKETPMAAYGALRVQGRNLVNEKGEKVQLYGMSTHGISWFPQFVSRETFQTLKEDWNTNCIRIAMYTAEYGGYCSGGSQEELKNLVKNGVSYATETGMYVIIDWHVLQDRDPNVYKDEAVTFFDEISALYGN